MCGYCDKCTWEGVGDGLNIDKKRCWEIVKCFQKVRNGKKEIGEIKLFKKNLERTKQNTH